MDRTLGQEHQPQCLIQHWVGGEAGASSSEGVCSSFPYVLLGSVPALQGAQIQEDLEAQIGALRPHGQA